MRRLIVGVSLFAMLGAGWAWAAAESASAARCRRRCRTYQRCVTRTVTPRYVYRSRAYTTPRYVQRRVSYRVPRTTSYAPPARRVYQTRITPRPRYVPTNRTYVAPQATYVAPRRTYVAARPRTVTTYQGQPWSGPLWVERKAAPAPRVLHMPIQSADMALPALPALQGSARTAVTSVGVCTALG